MEWLRIKARRNRCSVVPPYKIKMQHPTTKEKVNITNVTIKQPNNTKKNTPQKSNHPSTFHTPTSKRNQPLPGRKHPQIMPSSNRVRSNMSAQYAEAIANYIVNPADHEPVPYPNETSDEDITVNKIKTITDMQWYPQAPGNILWYACTRDSMCANVRNLYPYPKTESPLVYYSYAFSNPANTVRGIPDNGNYGSLNFTPSFGATGSAVNSYNLHGGKLIPGFSTNNFYYLMYNSTFQIALNKPLTESQFTNGLKIQVMTYGSNNKTFITIPFNSSQSNLVPISNTVTYISLSVVDAVLNDLLLEYGYTSTMLTNYSGYELISQEALPYIMNDPLITSIKKPICSILMTNTSAVLSKEGDIAGLQIPTGMKWWNFAGNYDKVARAKCSSGTLPAEHGIYGYQKMTSPDDVKFVPHMKNGTHVFDLDDETDSMIAIAKVNSTTGRNFVVTATHGIEFRSDNQLYPTVKVFKDSKVLDLANNTVTGLFQWCSNETHWQKLKSGVKTVINKSVNFIEEHGAQLLKVGEFIMKYAPMAAALL